MSAQNYREKYITSRQKLQIQNPSSVTLPPPFQKNFVLKIYQGVNLKTSVDLNCIVVSV